MGLQAAADDGLLASRSNSREESAEHRINMRFSGKKSIRLLAFGFFSAGNSDDRLLDFSDVIGHIERVHGCWCDRWFLFGYNDYNLVSCNPIAAEVWIKTWF